MHTLTVQTHRRNEWIDITPRVAEVVRRAGLKRGLCLVYCPHTTAAVTINEHADPDVAHDVLTCLARLVPHRHPDERHAEGNSDAHVKASLLGASVLVIVEGAELVLGQWQGIFFCEFDGPRSRQVLVQTLASA
ncbi:MAG: secondary thiamine-phosphate synthase enzyme YjbQ [Gemmataceae bacterium]|nr:secondary thiamine-phosphate synthase enzyme YjbQ [Gemmataceae bacterium]MDW8266472.1 secondary thiamine-phosphate synthase enzyme YjbQ [Gemmataceae bacterium]